MAFSIWAISLLAEVSDGEKGETSASRELGDFSSQILSFDGMCLLCIVYLG